MKKKVLLTLIILMIPVILFLCFRNNPKLKEGTYKIQDNKTYPDAYIVVQDNSIQFYNIDLNDLFKEEMVTRYIYFQETEYGALTDKEKEEVEASIDLNKLVCDQPYSLNYETSIRDEWNEYSNMFCKINSVNSFGYLYNTTAKTLSFGGGASSEIKFKR